MHKESKNMLEKVAAIIREQLNQENVEITEATRFKGIWKWTPWICLNW